MQLSNKAKAELRRVLIKDIGQDMANDFSDEELNRIGELLLNILAENLKMKVDGTEISSRVNKEFM